MANERDYRVRWALRFLDMGVALGLVNHANNLMDKTVPINPGQPNQELPFIKEANEYDVFGDMSFPPNKSGIARAFFNHLRNLLPQAINPDELIGFCELHRCGHRLGISCPTELLERYEVVKSGVGYLGVNCG